MVLIGNLNTNSVAINVLKAESSPMNTHYPNHQRFISGEFFLNESRLKTQSRKAYKKIQSWKASFHALEADPYYFQQMHNLLQHSFFNTVSNKFVLRNESNGGNFQKENLN